MLVLGINSAYHESAACLLHDGKIIAAVEEERLSRIKHAKAARVDNASALPLLAMQRCLDIAGATWKDIARVGFSFDPERRLQNSNLGDATVEGNWGTHAGERVFYQGLRQVPALIAELGFAGRFDWVGHHLCHAASAFYCSPFERSAVLVVDGIGETTSTQFALGEGCDLVVLGDVPYPASLGFLWEKLSRLLGFSEYDACKVMGLAAYGDPSPFASQFRQLVSLRPHGQFAMDNRVLAFRSESYQELEKLFGVRRRREGEPLRTADQDIAAALQRTTTEILMHVVHHLYEVTRRDDLCMAGGVALNCVANRDIVERGPFANVFIQPAAHDAGTAIGVAKYIWHVAEKNRGHEAMRHTFAGPCFSEEEARRALDTAGLAYLRHADTERTVAGLLANGAVVSWFQGAMEFGPRALGNRSLLADPRNPNMRAILNRKIKHREDFQPFGASILGGEVDRWFDIKRATSANEYMLVAYPARAGVAEKVPAVIHVDGSCRLHVTRPDANPRYERLLREFFNITGVPMLLNTSFNDNEPIVCTPADAIETFERGRIDHLVIGDLVVSRPARGGERST